MAKTTILGEEIKDGTETGKKVEVVVWRRQSGMYVCGVQGSGKSGLLHSLILQDIKQDQAVIVVDPHGDLVDDVVACMPEDKLEKTYVLDVTDRDFPYGLNMFSVSQHAGETERDIALNFVMHVFERLWHDSQGILLDKYLTNIAAVFLENPHHSIADIPRFLHDQAFRNQLTRHLNNIFVKAFWELEFNAMTPSEKRREVNALTNRINIFLSNPLVANIVAQNTSTIDFRRAIEEREIILIKFSKNLTKVAAIIGTMLISYIHQATFSFADTARVERPTFSLFVDEFQNFVTDDFAELFTEGRKFGVRTTIAHQDRKMLFGANVSSSLTANTIVSFKPTVDDASELAPLFLRQEARVQPEDIYKNVLDYLYEHNNPAVVAFWETYVKKLEQAPKEKTSYHYFDFGAGEVAFDPVFLKEEVIEPLRLLLYNVQKIGKVDEMLHRQVVSGVARLLRFDDYYFWHYHKGKSIHDTFVATLNAAIEALIKEPLGRKTYPAKSEVVQTLLNLPQRHALVRVGSEIFTMQTLQTLPKVPASEQQRRYTQIQEQSRQKYCRKRSDVENALQQRHVTLPSNEPDEIVKAPLQESEEATWSPFEELP